MQQIGQAQDPFLVAFRGSFTSALRWPQLDALWQRVRERAGAGWYVYRVGEAPPGEPVGADALCAFIREIDERLRQEHKEDYCGIVYADDLQAPGFLKIYDPKNLGVSCGCSDNPPLPGWILSRIPPTDLQDRMPRPAERRRWWRRRAG